MKYLLYVAFAVIVVASCKREEGSFTVSGKIKTPPSDTVYLEQLSYQSAETKILDSAKVSSDGSYRLKGVSPQQNLFVISFRHNPAVILVNDGKDIKIDFDLGGFHYPQITGSDATKELYTFIQDYWHRDSILSTTYYQLDSFQKENSSDTILANT
ncbi:MAG TPA: DUF4369 domain-containing protein, partial [Chitinophagaceae bacterium]